MGPVNSTSPLQKIIPVEVNLQILSFLGKRDLQAIACTCKIFENLSKDFQIWKPKTEIEFGELVAKGAKQPHKSWKQTYEELKVSKTTREESTEQIIQTQIKKTTTNDLQFRTNSAASALFGFATPNLSTHYSPTGQIGSLGNRKITVYKKKCLITWVIFAPWIKGLFYTYKILK